MGAPANQRGGNVRRREGQSGARRTRDVSKLVRGRGPRMERRCRAVERDGLREWDVWVGRKGGVVNKDKGE
eukprot:914471-Pleurochrysis_carterae.AAC.4